MTTIKELVNRFADKNHVIDMHAQSGRPGVHFDAGHLDNKTSFIATDAEKIAAMLLTGNICFSLGAETAISWSTGNYRRAMEMYYGFGYFDQKTINGQRVRNVVVGKLAGWFALTWQTDLEDFFPEDLLGAIQQRFGHSQVASVANVLISIENQQRISANKNSISATAGGANWLFDSYTDPSVNHFRSCVCISPSLLIIPL